MCSDETYFRLQTLNRRTFNTTLLRRRGFDGHIVSMQQSGSHWIKYMMSLAMAEIYDLPEPEHIQADTIVGHPKTRPLFTDKTPCIVHSHSMPHAFLFSRFWSSHLHFPKYLILVRDLKTSLISHYERFKGDYDNVDWDTYLRGDIRQKKFHSDLFSRIRFMNEWGAVMERHPDKTSVLKYEDLQKDSGQALVDVLDFFGVEGLTDEILEKVKANSTKDAMAKKPNPDITTTVIRTEHKKATEDYFHPENQKYLEDVCARFLKYDFGYKL